MLTTAITIIREMRLFLIIWLGQVTTFVGSSITAFALDIWVYERTGSVTQFALITLFNTLPLFLIAPIAGPFIDRWDKRWTMIISDMCASLGTLAIGALLIFGKLEVWHIYLANIFSSAFIAFQAPAYIATNSVIVPQKHLTRANGMMSLLYGLSRIAAPPLGGVLLGMIHLQGIIVIDFITVFFAIVPLMFLRIPEIKSTPESVKANSFFEDVTYGWKYLRERPGLLGLMFISTFSVFITGGIQVITTPLVLTYAPITVLGTILSIFGSGIVIGSLLSSIWGSSQRSIETICLCTLVAGILVFISGLTPSLIIFTICICLYFVISTFASSPAQALFQRKVDINVQGRVFSMKGAIDVAFYPLGYIVVGPLAENVFEPLMSGDNLLTHTIGQIIGVGSGRGMSLLLIILGLLTIIPTGFAYLSPRLRLIEEELPDIVLGTEENLTTTSEPVASVSSS
jgi:MFS family permease